jgi:N-acyl-D-amino-acid deacylase
MGKKTIVHGGTLIDGTGAPPRPGDILMEEGFIRAVGIVPARDQTGAECIDGAGKTVCPGFIDLHRHCDTAVLGENFGFIELSQGITSCMAGNCGMAPVPNRDATRAQLQNYLQPCLGSFARENFTTHGDYLARLKAAPLPLNMGFFAGMGAIRIAVKGFEPSPFSPGEMEKTRALLEEALDAGAFGMSIGLMYVPELYSSEKEIAALASVMKGGRGILCTHMRYETEKLYTAVQEVISIAKRAEVPLEISHFKAAGPKAWGGVLHQTIELIEAERAKGMDITVDFYPYDCGASTMMQMLPPAYLGMGIDEAINGLNNPANVQKMRKLLNEGEEGWDNLSKTIGWDRTIISSVNLKENEKFLGKTVSACVNEFAYADEADFVAQLMYSEKGKVAIIYQSMSRDDIDTIARLPYSSLVSDALYGDMKGPHPRLTGAFPRFLREFVHERKVLNQETAIRKMSALPAGRLGLKDRGLLKPGYRADVLVFDPDQFRDTSTFLAPAGTAAGLDYAFIKGEKVFENGRLLRRDSGEVMTKPPQLPRIIP